MNRLTTMRDALSLMRRGNLAAATDVIRQKLLHLSGLGRAPAERQTNKATTVTSREAFTGRHARTHISDLERLPGVEDVAEVTDIDETFTEASFISSAGSRRYKLFMPAGNRGSPLPLVVMLHGCTQTPDDFALGTGMNELAATHRCAVVYPEQTSAANGMKCWNWFQSTDQRRDHGEPAIIAGITREILTTYGLDPNRVYVAGLSAGGAMAVVMGRTYPDLYAAVGVHSGIPYAVAHDAASAFAVMKGAESRPRHSKSIMPRWIPTIVLHGDSDKTVHPSNGEKLVEQFNAGGGSAAMDSVTEHVKAASGGGRVSGARAYSRTLLRDKSGKVVVEYWLVHGAGHAWFGGNPRGSHTDPKSPDASAAILRFFLANELTQRHC